MEPAGAAPPVDRRLVELLFVVLCAATATSMLANGDQYAGLLVVPASAFYAAVVLQPRPSRFARIASVVVLLAALAVLPALVQAAANKQRPSLDRGQDGGVIVTDLAVKALLAGRDPYTESYADPLDRIPIWFGSRRVDNPIRDRYPYWPATLLVQLPVQAPLLWAGAPLVDARYVYLIVLVALGVGLARWSLRTRGDLLLAAAIALNPLLLIWTRWGANDVLAVAALALMGWALFRRRTVLAGLALGLALAAKLLVAPVVVLFVVWLARRARDGELRAGTAARAAAMAVLPAAVTALPFLLWHPAAFLDDAVLYHLGVSQDPFPIAGQGLPALLVVVGAIHDQMGQTQAWATTVPTLLVLGAAAGWLWRRGASGPRTLLLASALMTVGTLWASRDFMQNYWTVPLALLALAVLVPWPAGRAPDGPEAASPATADTVAPAGEAGTLVR